MSVTMEHVSLSEAEPVGPPDRCFVCDREAFAIYTCRDCDCRACRFFVCPACSGDMRCPFCGNDAGDMAAISDNDSSAPTEDDGRSYRNEDDDAASWLSEAEAEPDSDDDYDTEAKCYMPDTVFHLADGRPVMVQDLQPGMQVPTHGGLPITVQKVESHHTIDTAGMLLTSNSFQILLSIDHRVVVPRGPHNRQQAIPASHLRAGDHVCCETGIVVLRYAEPIILQDGYKFEVTFVPDLPVSAFWVGQDQLLTFGKKHPGNQRGLQRPALRMRVIQSSDNWATELNDAYWKQEGKVGARLQLVDRFGRDLRLYVVNGVAQTVWKPTQGHFPLILRW